MSREFDVVLYGATGFTGQQTVRYFAQHAPKDVNWAIAGRNLQKLEALQAGVPILIADSARTDECTALAARTRVLLTTAGPYALYGDKIVAACVDSGTHYVDITGEVAWVRSLIDKYHHRAQEQGVRIVPFCGFDSVPADLGVYLLAKVLGPELSEAKAYFQVRGGLLNGGTIASADTTYSTGAADQGKDLFVLCPGKTRARREMEEDPILAAFDREVLAWVAPFPMSIIDTRVVQRSCDLMGIDLAYQEYLILSGAFAPLFANGVALGTSLFYKAMQSTTVRGWLKRTFQPGSGPSDAVMDKGWFQTHVRGRTTDGRTAEVVLSGRGDPSNRITVKCVCESALAIACASEGLPERWGVLTPSSGIGEALVERLQQREFHISVQQT